MQIARIGPWQFAMPEGLLHKPSERFDSYFENEERTLGLYVRDLEATEAKLSASQYAEYIQSVYLAAFKEDTPDAWETVDQRLSTDGELARSALDIYDRSANYRVLSLVVATNVDAVQINVHDYWCEDYQAAKSMFSSLERSIVRIASSD